MSTYLRERGQIHVSSRAAGEYATFTGLQMEEARRRLTELLLDATLRPNGTWRRRNQTDRVDITAHVMQEGALNVVTHVFVRSTGPKRSERPNHGYPQR